jgi:hypothetical protein
MGGGTSIMESFIQEEKDYYCSVPNALANFKQGAIYSISGNDYDTLDWHVDNTITKPTKAEVDAEVLRLTNEWNTKQLNIGIKRQGEYPPLADFADAMYWSSKGDDSKLTSYYEKCDAVKTKYPKE